MARVSSSKKRLLQASSNPNSAARDPDSPAQAPKKKTTTATPRDAEEDRPVRVYADGIFDLFHFGHARALEQAKKLWVDEVIPDAPWVLTQEFIDKHQIDYVAHDALPYADTSGAANDVCEFVKKIGKFKETKRTDGVSTSELIMRILKDYNQYVTRNLARGYSRKDLGLSYVKEKQLQVNMKINKLRETEGTSRKGNHDCEGTSREVANCGEDSWDKSRRMARQCRSLGCWFPREFEEHCHNMETAIKDRIQEKLGRQASKGIIAVAGLMQQPVAAA